MDTVAKTVPPETIPECLDCGCPLSLLEMREMLCTDCDDALMERMRQQAAQEAREDAARETFEDREYWGTR